MSVQNATTNRKNKVRNNMQKDHCHRPSGGGGKGIQDRPIDASEREWMTPLQASHKNQVLGI